MTWRRAIVLLCGLAAFALALAISRWFAIDDCMDHGGVWAGTGWDCDTTSGVRTHGFATSALVAGLIATVAAGAIGRLLRRPSAN